MPAVRCFEKRAGIQYAVLVEDAVPQTPQALEIGFYLAICESAAEGDGFADRFEACLAGSNVDLYSRLRWFDQVDY